MEQQDFFARHGGVHFINEAPPEEINAFVNNLPESKRDSLFTVLNELQDAGLIKIHNDGLWADGDGDIGGSDEC